MLVKLLTISGLIAIMLSMGFKVKLEELTASIRDFRQVIAGLAANFVLAPALTFALLYFLETDAMVSVGFLILAVCPGSPVGPSFTAIAKGDLSYATGQMVILAGLSALLSPALLTILLVRLLPAHDVQINYLGIIQTLLVSQLLPLAVGLCIHRWAPNFTARMVKPVGVLANLLLLGVIAILLVREFETLQVIRMRGWIGMLILLVGSVGMGWLLGGPARATRKALSLTTGARNAAAALVIASSSFSGTPAVTAVVAYGLVSILGTLACAWAFGSRAFGVR